MSTCDETEIPKLHQHIARLEEELAALKNELSIVHDMIAQTPAGLFVKSVEGRYLIVNPLTAIFLERSPEELIGRTEGEIFPGKTVERWHQNDAPVMKEGKCVQVEAVVHHEDGLHTYLTTRFPIYNAAGEIYAMGGISFDITERNQTQAARAVWQLQVNDALQQALRELSTPILPLTNDIIVMPLIGTIDNIRAQQIMDTLLEGISKHHATIAIIDITGVQAVDVQIARVLLQAALAVSLLGAQVILTGVQPQAAMALAGLGESLEGIITRSTLKDGIAYAMGNNQIKGKKV